MVKKLLLASLIFGFLIVTACSNEVSQIYIGESDNWEVNYGRDDNIAIKYIGEEAVPETEINYVIEQSSSTLDGNQPLNSDGVMFIYMPQPEDGKIEITINWDGSLEEITLERR